MRLIFSPLFLVLVLGWVVPQPGLGESLTAIQIAEKAREKDRENLRRFGTTACRLVEIKEELDENGAVVEKEERTLRTAFSTAPVPGNRETQRISPDIQKIRSDEDTSVLDHLELFDWKLEAEDDSPGEPCYRLGFRPKKGVQSQGPRHLILTHSRGHCWIAKKDYSKVRLEGRLTKPMDIVGFLVTVQEVDFLTTTQRMAQGIAAPAQVRYRFRVEVFPFFEFHERHTQRFEFLNTLADSAQTGRAATPRGARTIQTAQFGK